MSKKKNVEADGTDETADDAAFPADDSAAGQDEFSVEPLVDEKSKSGVGVVSWIALLLAVLALATVGLDYFRERNASGEVAERSAELRTLEASLGRTQDALTSLEQSVTAMNAGDATQDSRLDAIGRQLDDRLRQLEAMPGRLSSVEASVASVQGISTGARAAWLLAEAEYYMQIANAQLQLANNPTLASTALAHADERILQLGDPRLTNVRQALSDELRSLEILQTPDTAGITLTLASLASVVESLPLRQETIVGVEDPAEAVSDLTGMDRALETVKKTIGDAVKVRRSDEAMQPLIAPEAQYFLRANLALQLQVARLALLRGEEVVFQQSLIDADAWLTEYYDMSNTGVQSARETLTEIRNNVLAVAMPDISQSLRLLRQFNALNAAATNADTADDADNSADETEQDQ
ncbi:MAG: uroporphyrinogen-III C-methyltransferase [Woeseiaceae bacterium]